MEKGYFAAAWGDITKSPGWFSKIMRLGLLCLIPVFGLIVLYGYLYGWARDIAWNVHRPMPDKIFGNEDGKLYKRGFFILVIGFVFSLIPGLFNVITSMITGVSLFGSVYSHDLTPAVGGVFLGFLFSIAGLVLTFAVVFFVWVGSMRTSLYGTLSSGFQIGKIWAMLRYDFMGLLRIFGMYLLSSLIIGVALVVVFLILVFVGILIAVPFIDSSSALAAVMVIVAILFFLLFIVACFAMSVFVTALVSRALGYWTRQFQVNLWGGQEDPMPFEREQAQRSRQQYDAYTAQQQNNQEPYHNSAANTSYQQQPFPQWNGEVIYDQYQQGQYQAQQPQPGQYQTPQPTQPQTGMSQASPQGYAAPQPQQPQPQAQPQSEQGQFQGVAPQPVQPMQPISPIQPQQPMTSSQPLQPQQPVSSAQPAQMFEGNASAAQSWQQPEGVQGQESFGKPQPVENQATEPSNQEQESLSQEQPPIIEVEPVAVLDASVEKVDEPTADESNTKEPEAHALDETESKKDSDKE